MKHERDLSATDDSAEMFRHDSTLARRIAMKLFGSFFFARAIRSQHRLSLHASTQIRDVGFIEGFQITVRRGVAARCGFDEALVSSQFEDLDASIRFGQKGAVVMLDRPLIYHARAERADSESRRGVMARFGWILNIAYLNRKYFGDGWYVRLFCWTHWLRWLLLDLALSPVRRDCSRVKGCWLALPALREMTFARAAQVREVLVRRTEGLKFALQKPAILPTEDVKLKSAA
jgi:hypothetical protein